MPTRSGLAYRWRCCVLQWHLVLGRRAAARRVLDAMLVRWPGDAHALASRAHLRAQAGDRCGAIDDGRRLVQQHPSQSAAWFNLGFLHEEAGAWDEALHAFGQATHHDPGLDRAWYGLGLVLARLGRYEEAAAALERNTALQPMSPHGWVQLARVQLERQRPREALQIIRHLEGFEPRAAAQLRRETAWAAPRHGGC